MTDRRRVFSASPYEQQFGFARAVRVGNLVSVSGTAPIGDDGRTVGAGDPEAQTRRCLEIAEHGLERLGASLRDVFRTRMFVTRIDDWKTIGRVHGEFFGEIRPAATLVEVSRLIDPDWLVEIEAEAIVP